MSWQKQTKDNPLFEDLIWSKPENKLQAGKLLIIGGNLYSFSNVSESYKIATAEGAGQIRMVLPTSLKKTLSKLLPDSDFAPVNPSGGFSKIALADFMENSLWSDLVLFAGDLGRNSETSILVEKFLQDSKTPTILTKEAADSFIHSAKNLINRPSTTLVINLTQLQQLSKNTYSEFLFKFSLTMEEIAINLENFSKKINTNIVVNYQDNIWCACSGRVSSTPHGKKDDLWITEVAAKSSVWLMQNPTKPFEALTTALL